MNSRSEAIVTIIARTSDSLQESETTRGRAALDELPRLVSGRGDPRRIVHV